MGFYAIITLCIIMTLAITVIFILRRVNHSQMENDSHMETNQEISLSEKEMVSKKASFETVRFEDLNALTENEMKRLVEIKDHELISRIDNFIPGTLQAMANVNAIKNSSEVMATANQLYQAIIPKGAVLDQSRVMKGAFRASFRDVPNSIRGNANLKPVEGTAVNGLTTMNIVNSVMSVASMVVGQYYMAQISQKCDGISDNLSKISDFQSNEYKSKVYALVAGVQKCSEFQTEIFENSNLRNMELNNLKNMEHECAQLLGQANLMIKSIAEKNDLAYDKYEREISEANVWYHYIQIILQVMYKIDELAYVLNMGMISRKNSCAMYITYAKQTEDTLAQLSDWHKSNINKFEIDLGTSRRKKQGIKGEFFKKVAFFLGETVTYKEVSSTTIDMINEQSKEIPVIKTSNESLFNEDVRLIIKDGRLYYLPS